MKWKTMPQETPTLHQTCWVRLNYWFGAPFLAYWEGTEIGWVSINYSINYPNWTISRWKEYVP
jgi:hypothetical protein